MELLVIVILCVLVTAADGSSPDVIKVEVGRDVFLPCSLSSKKGLTYERFEWKKDGGKKVYLYDAGITYERGSPDQDREFKGRVSHLQEELKNGIASIEILRTRLSDSGNYTCDFPNLQPPQTFRVELWVGAASKPFIETLSQTKSEAVLQCEVNGASPEPVLQWKDSSGNILPAKEPQVTESEGKYDVILQTTVTKSDRYTCVVTQLDIRHQTEAGTLVHISGPSTGVIIGSVVGVFIVGVAVGVGGYFCYNNRRSTQGAKKIRSVGNSESEVV